MALFPVISSQVGDRPPSLIISNGHISATAHSIHLYSAYRAVIFAIAMTFIEDLFSDADNTLFERFVYYPSHVLHHILPAKSEQPYNLRERRHNYSFVKKTSELNDRDYITRILYKDISSFFIFHSFLYSMLRFVNWFFYTNI